MGDKLLLNYLSNNLSGSNIKEKFNQHSTGNFSCASCGQQSARNAVRQSKVKAAQFLGFLDELKPLVF
jgi:hypothetical protein